METKYGPISCPPKYGIPKRSQKIVIFDSPDGTGKTNISQALSAALNIPYFRMATQHQNWRKGKFKEALEFDQTYLVEFLRQTKYNAIIDRAYPAEWVYSQVYGRETNMEVLEQVDKEFARLGTYIIIPLRHDYANNRKDEVVANEMLPKLHEKYLEFRNWTRCGTITIFVDAFGNDLKKELDAIIPELEFDGDLTWSFNITLDKAERIKKPTWDLHVEPKETGREVGFKSKR